MRDNQLLRATRRLERTNETQTQARRGDYAQALTARDAAEAEAMLARDLLAHAYEAWPATMHGRFHPEDLQRFAYWLDAHETRADQTEKALNTARERTQTASASLALSMARSSIIKEHARALGRRIARRHEERRLAELELRYAFRAVRQ